MSPLSLAQAPSAPKVALQRRTIPYDYQFYFKLFDEKDEKKRFLNQTQTSAVIVSIEAAFVAVSIGYGFLPRVRTIIFGPREAQQPALSEVRFGEIVTSLAKSLGEDRPGLPLGPLTARALIAGIQLNTSLAQRALQVLREEVVLKPDELGEVFQTVELPTDRIEFLYALYDKGTGRAFQSEPLLNIAGLGISDGDRPFRYFATPIVFAPRSTIQLDVIPKTDFRGELYVTLHGYKVLGGVGTPTGHKLRGPTPVSRMRWP